MDSGDMALRVTGVSKSYRIWSSPAAGFKGPALAALAKCLPAGSSLSRSLFEKAAGYFSDFFALRDISLDVQPGESVGIIGRNGSGKSTLLQIIAGTLTPTTGSVLVQGRVTALLELGSGFNIEFTGRENVYLNGSIMGITKEEMDEKFDEIAAFADIGEFIDQPLKTYSSGMIVRLAFAVQSLLDPDVLIVDEALAVGDIFFRQKCFDRMQKLIDRGVAILLVTHDLGAVNRFCSRSLLLHRGECRFLGPADEATKFYQQMVQAEEKRGEGSDADRTSESVKGEDDVSMEVFPWPGTSAFVDVSKRAQISNDWAICTKVALCDAAGNACSIFEQGHTASFFYEIELLHDVDVPSAGASIQDKTGQIVHVKHFLQHELEPLRSVPRGSRLRYRQDVQLNLNLGEYTFEIGFFDLPRDVYDAGQVSNDAFMNRYVRILETERLGPFSVIARKKYSGLQLTHWGVADLPGRSVCRLVPPRAAGFPI